MDEDTALMMSFKAGNESSFAELMKRYYRKILNFAYRFTADKNMCEDMAQEIFYKIYSTRQTYKPETKFSTFLYRVAANHCLNEIRKGHYKMDFKSIQKETGEGRGHNPRDIYDEKAKTPEEIFEEKIMEQRILKALNSLPERQRLAFILVKYNGLSYEEAAESLETTVKAVKSLLNRCRVQLVAIFKPLLESGEMKGGVI